MLRNGKYFIKEKIKNEKVSLLKIFTGHGETSNKKLTKQVSTIDIYALPVKSKTVKTQADFGEMFAGQKGDSQ